MTDDYLFELRDMINYHSAMSVDVSFGVLGDGERMAGVDSIHACMLMHTCMHAEPFGDRSPWVWNGAVFEQPIVRRGSAHSF